MKLLEKFIKHNHGESELHDGLRSLCEILVVKGEPSEVLKPGERALYDPPLGQHREPGRAVVGPEDDLKVPSEQVGHPVSKRALVSAVGKNPLQARELVLQLLDSLRRTLAVVEVGLMDGDGHRHHKCVNHNMFLASFDLLVPVCPLAGRVGVMRGLDAAGVDYPQAGALLAAGGLAGERVQGVYHVLDHTIELPLAEVIVHGRPRGEVLWEHTPLAPGLDYVKYRVHYPSERMFPLPFLCVYDFFLLLSAKS